MLNEDEKLAKRMDKFDSIITEYLRSSGYSTDELAMKLGVNKQPYAFGKAPFVVVTKAMRLAQVSNETMRYICGL